ncbi:MAG TPA: GGDEF domain-containing protein [Planctomycetota bacterium]|nr:GGDEF domain-containing protein [Planctomycetota bacterium]
MSESGDTDFNRTVFSVPNEGQGKAAPPPRLPVLVVLRGEQVGRRYLLNENSLVIGRRPDRADLVVPGDAQISSVHCRIERGPQPDTWQVVDLSSTNGTYIAGQRITTLALRDGDRVHVGETVLKFCYHDELEEEFHRQVDHLMNIDDLTGLPVQRVFQVRFADNLAFCTRRNRPMAVFMMDMDGLKRINDTHGHLLGAHTIATVGKRLGTIVQKAGGVVSRFGGDEFSAFVPDCDREGALALGETMRAAVADEPITRGTVLAAPTISIGVAVYPLDGDLAEQLTRQADEALYRAKAAGRNRVST